MCRCCCEPDKTSFNFEILENCKKCGKLVEVTPVKKMQDKMYDMEVTSIKINKAVISNKIWVTKKRQKLQAT